MRKVERMQRATPLRSGHLVRSILVETETAHLTTTKMKLRLLVWPSEHEGSMSATYRKVIQLLICT